MLEIHILVNEWEYKLDQIANSSLKKLLGFRLFFSPERSVIF